MPGDKVQVNPKTPPAFVDEDAPVEAGDSKLLGMLMRELAFFKSECTHVLTVT